MIPSAGRPRVVSLRDRADVRRSLAELGVSPAGASIMEGKALFRALSISGLDPRAAGILKQEMLSRGGDVALSASAYGLEPGAVEKTDLPGATAGDTVDCLVLGTVAQYDEVLPKLRQQPLGLAELADALDAALTAWDGGEPATHPGLDLRHRPLVMGILNVTPDSFSDGGDFFGAEVAIREAHRMVEEGAALVDVGGESTRPGSERVSLEEELRRVVPVVESLSGALPASISVDTYKAEVAARAIDAGAYMINDISALRFDPELAPVLRDADCPVVLMHMLGEPRTMQQDPRYDDVVADVYGFFVERLNAAVDAGLREENLIIDPGIGFGKTLAHNLELIRHIGTFRCLGRPVLLGASRKRFLGDILGLADPKDRVHGTVATSVLATIEDVDILRVHDVAANVQAARTARAILPVRRGAGGRSRGGSRRATDPSRMEA